MAREIRPNKLISCFSRQRGVNRVVGFFGFFKISMMEELFRSFNIATRAINVYLPQGYRITVGIHYLLHCILASKAVVATDVHVQGHLGLDVPLHGKHCLVEL